LFLLLNLWSVAGEGGQDPIAVCEAIEDEDGDDEACYQALYDDDKNDCPVRSAAGVQLAFSISFKKKAKLLRDVVKLCPDELTPRIELAKVLMKKRETREDTMEILEAGIMAAARNRTELGILYYNMAQAHKTMGNAGAAISAYKSAMELQPLNTDARKSLMR
jgi:predicted Zn-dependent protease